MLEQRIKQDLQQIFGTNPTADKLFVSVMKRMMKFRQSNNLSYQFMIDGSQEYDPNVLNFEQIDHYIHQVSLLIIGACLCMKNHKYLSKLYDLKIDFDQNYNDVIFFVLVLANNDRADLVFEYLMQFYQPDKICLSRQTYLNNLVIYDASDYGFNMYIDRLIHDREDAIQLYQDYLDYMIHKDIGLSGYFTVNQKNNLITLYNKYGQPDDQDPIMHQLYLKCCSYVIETNDPHRIQQWFSKFPPPTEQIIYIPAGLSYTIETLIVLSEYINLSMIGIVQLNLVHEYHNFMNLIEYELSEDEYSLETLQFLMDHIDVNQGSSLHPLFRATIENDTNLLSFLSNYPIQYNVEDSQGNNILYHACDNNNIQLAEYLFNRGMRINFDPDTMDDEVRSWSHKKLIEYYYRIETPRHGKNIEFMRACANGDEEYAKKIAKSKIYNPWFEK